MSSVCVTWTKSNKPASEVYAGNHNWLSEQLASVVSEIKDKECEIAQVVNLNTNFEYELQNKMDSILSKHTWQLFNQNNYTSQHDELVEEFNDFAQDIKFALAELRDTVENELEYQLNDIAKNINLVEYADELSSQYSDIINKHEELDRPSSIDTKLSIIAEIEAMIDEYEDELLIVKETKKQKRIAEQNLGIGQEVSNSLDELSLKEQVTTIKPFTIKQEQISKQLERYLEKIKYYDFSRYKILEKQYTNSTSSERLKIVFSSVKLEYDSLKRMHLWTTVYKDELNLFLCKISSITTFNADLVKKINTLMSQKNIVKSEFKKIQQEFQLYIKTSNERNELSTKLQENLKYLGYTVSSNTHSDNITLYQQLSQGEIVYLDTDIDAYKIMIKLNKDMGFSIRFTKMVATQHEIDNVSSYQRQKDQENAKKWCNNYDKLCQLLKQHNINVHDKLRQEPDGVDISYMINKDLAAKESETAKAEQYLRKINE